MNENTYQKLRRVLGYMKDRCNNPNDKHYHYYGGRGIKICDRWSDTTRVSNGNVGNNPTQGFLNFVEDMGSTYFEGATIDRIDNNGDYCLENCQWLSINENTRKAHTGRTFSDEHRRKLSESQTGHTVSEETRQKISESQKGRTFSEEHRRKLSEAGKGRTFSDEHRRKLSEAAKARTLSEEHCRKISESLKGLKHSE